MTSWLRYHLCMRRWLPALLVTAVIAMPLGLQGQINGTRASVTSLGGAPFFPPGPRASVTSLGPLGFTPNFALPNCCFSFGRNHHHSNGFANGRFGFGVGVLPLYSMPYYYGGYADIANPVDDTMEQAYGPVSDRMRTDQAGVAQQNDERLTRLEKQMDEMRSAPATKPEPTTSEAQAPLADQPETVLVFRDGHSVDVKNYAIVGDTLYDFSNGSRHKIALADLDLSATEKQNEERGLDFRLPTRRLGN